MFPIPFYDVLEVLPSKKFNFTQSGIKIDSLSRDNLCVKAYDLIKEKYSIQPVYMHLQKNIPMGAGLGGGSSDAASILKALNELFNLNISNIELLHLASCLGSDCPFFIDSKPKYCTEKGESMNALNVDLTGLFVKLVYPNINVSTKQAYSNVKCDIPTNNLNNDIHQQINKWKLAISNSFEESVFQIFPILSSIKQSLYAQGAIYASMTGSGSTIFGIYENLPPKAKCFHKDDFEFICAL